MPSDRSTLQRGLQGGAEPQSSWPDPTAPAGRRLPTTPRERKPALAALAVLLILGCALGTAYLVIQSGKRVAAVEITQAVGAGQRIPLSAMTEVQIASDTGLSYVPWNQAAQVGRYYAASGIPAGTLLTNAMVAAQSASTQGKAVMGLALKDGQLPHGLQVGQHVSLYEVSDSTESCPGSPGSTLAANAIVLAISTPSLSSGNGATSDVEVALSPADSGAVACNASNGLVGIAILPNGGRGAHGGAPGTGTPGAGGAGAPGAGSSTTASPGTGSSPPAGGAPSGGTSAPAGGTKSGSPTGGNH
jgi:hypothetical protein